MDNMAELHDDALRKLEEENGRLLEYIRQYQKQLERYEGSLAGLEKCTEPDEHLESIDIRRRLERQDKSSQALWAWIDRLNEKLPGECSLFHRLTWILNPLAVWHYRRLKKNDYKPILKYFKSKGEIKTARLLLRLPLNNAVRAKIWSDISRSLIKRDAEKAEKYAAWAWKIQPRPYRLKYLAFRLHETGKHEIARCLLEALPPDMQFSDSELRSRRQIEKAAEKTAMEEKKKPASRIDVVLITDDNYALPTLVAAWSICKSSNTPIYLNVIHTGQKNIAPWFKPFESDRFKINIMKLSPEVEDYYIRDDFHVSSAAILKFRLPELFPDLDKILYLDSDVLVLGDLQELWEQDLKAHYGAFVEDIKPKLKYTPNQLERLNIERHGAYFNSGMMLLNLEMMRRDKITEKLFRYRREGLNFFMDQDAFNVVLGGKAKFIDLRYNFLLTLPEDFSRDEIKAAYGVSLEENENIPRALILHYCSPEKPWNATGMKCADLWLEYLLEYLRNFGAPACLEDLGEYDKIVVSLTSWPRRIGTVHKVVADLKNQSLPAARIILWLAEEEFPGARADLPPELTEQEDAQFEIRFCKNLKSYKKLIPTLKLYADRIIVTADDDQHYNRHWLWELFQSWLARPQSVHCHRAHKLVFSFGQLENYGGWLYNHCQKEASGLLFPTGCGGILYPPSCFLPSVLDEEQFSRLCPTGDDIWFWAMAHMNGRVFCRVPNSSFEVEPLEGTQEQSLFHDNIAGGKNDVMLRKVLFYYPFIKNALCRENYGAEAVKP